MFSKPLVAALLLLGFLATSVPAQTLPVYSNGLDNTANGTQANVLITDSPPPASLPTTVHFISPANVTTLRIEGFSVADLAGGSIGTTNAFGYSKNTLTNGTGSIYNLNDSSSLTIQGGAATTVNALTWGHFTLNSGTAGQVSLRDGSNGIVQGGNATSLQAFDLASATISGGTLGSIAALGKFGDSGTPAANGHAWIFFNSGSVGTASAGGGGVISILGGTVQSLMETNLGTANVFGGRINGLALAAGTTTNVYGYNLNIANNVLNGMLADGTPIEAPISNRQGSSVINLFNISGPVPIPEPSSFVLLGFAMTGFGIVVARRKKR
jgi:hypothetical protein